MSANNMSKAYKLYNAFAGNTEDESGWVTESSACFEDTLFGESPKKPNTTIRSRNTTAAFIPFGGAVVKTRDNVNHHNAQGANSKSTIKRKFGGDTSSRGNKEIQAVVTNPRQASMKQAADLLDKHDMHEEGSRTEKIKGKDFIREDNGNKPSIGNEKSRTAMMGPPLVPPAGNYKNTSNSNHILPNSLPPKRKPLSSVGLSAMKSGVVAEKTVPQSTTTRKSSLSGPAFPPSAKRYADTDVGLKQAGDGQFHKGARSVAPKQDNTRYAFCKRKSS